MENIQLPPQAQDAEEMLLALILGNNKCLHDVSSLLTPESFYNFKYGEIFRAMQQVSKKGNIDIITLMEQLKDNGKDEKIGGVVTLMQIEQKANYGAIPLNLARIIFEKQIRRDIIFASQKAIKAAHDETVEEFSLLDEVKATITDFYKRLSGGNKRTIIDIVDSYLKQIEEAIFNRGKGTGIRSYIPCFDNRLGGLGKGRMITIAARPGMGKTAFIIQILTNIALKNDKLPFVVYTIEMTAEEIVNRLISCIIGYPYSRIANGDIEGGYIDNFNRCAEYLKACGNLHIVDNLNDIDSICYDMKARHDEHGIRGAMIDYVQICKVKDKKQNREQEVTHISLTIKGTAKELKIPILTLAQLNREVEKRGNKKPILADLRESGSLEQDSDSVTFIFRPVYAGMTHDKDGMAIPDSEAWLYTEKNRHGPVGEDQVWCDIATNKFKDIDTPPEYGQRQYQQQDYSQPHSDTPF